MGRKQKWRESLLWMYSSIAAGAGIILLLSFLATHLIMTQIVRSRLEKSAEVIFQQAYDSLELFEEEIDYFYSAFSTENQIYHFIRADSLEERSRYLDAFYQMVGNSMRINKNLRSVSIYDEKKNLIFNKGEIFVPMPEGVEPQDRYMYTGISEKDGNRYFGIAMPVYEKQAGEYASIGITYLLFDTADLEKIMETALFNEESAVGIVDAGGWTILSSGVWKPSFGEMEASSMDGGKYLCEKENLDTLGWSLINVIPRDSLLNGMDEMQLINDLAYAVMFFVLVGIIWLLYRKILRPIRYQMQFMTAYKTNIGKRIEVLSNNEMGLLAREMNHMLDDIESLNKKVIREQKRYLELEYAKKQTEMIAYKSQINPHFMYNAFECIRGMALYHGEEEIADLVGALTKLFRYNVKGSDIVPLREEFQHLREYSRIIHYRFMEKIRICMEAEDSVLKRKVPKMLLQPLVENAVLHGLEPSLAGGEVHIRAEEGKNGFLLITIEDNGCGISQKRLAELRRSLQEFTRMDSLEGKAGVGILNVCRRMRLFYGENAKFSIESREGKGTILTLLFLEDPVGS